MSTFGPTKVAASANDARNINGATGKNITATTQYLGKYSDGNDYWNGFIWTNVTIPQGSQINSATLELYGAGVEDGTTVNTIWYGVDEDNTASFNTTTSYPEGKTRTTASVSMNFTSNNWTGIGYNPETIDVTTLVQEIVDRAGWASGNNMGIVAHDNGSSANSYIGISTYDRESVRGARLTINYGEEGGGGGEWLSYIQAWIYPGEPACNADEEYSDGRTIHVLKAEYYTVNSLGVLEQLTVASSGCNAYSAENAADVLSKCNQAFVTISSNRANMATLVANSTKKTNAINTIVSFLQTSGFHGVELDWEGYGQWTTTEYNNYKTFVAELADAVHAVGKLIMLDGPPIGNVTEQGYYEWQYEDFESMAIDYIVAMAYDWQYDFGAGTSISPNDRVENVCDWVKTKISDINRIVIGMPSYGYHGVTDGYSITIDTKTQSSAYTGYDTATRNSDYEMTWVNAGVSYFYQDTTGMNSKRDIIEAKGIKNISVWHLGGNDWFSGKTEISVSNETDQPYGGEFNGNITMVRVEKITKKSVVAVGNLEYNESVPILKMGFVVGKDSAPFIGGLNDTYIKREIKEGEFSLRITGLQPNTRYYIRAFVQNQNGTYYG